MEPRFLKQHLFHKFARSCDTNNEEFFITLPVVVVLVCSLVDPYKYFKENLKRFDIYYRQLYYVPIPI